MPVSVADSAGVPRQAVNITVLPDGVTQRPAKSVKVSDGFGWRIAWVPPVRVASVGFSKTNVNAGELFDVTLTVPGGVPEGTVVEFASGAFRQSLDPQEGATAVILSGVSNVNVGANVWTATVVTMGGTTSFTATQTVAPAPGPTEIVTDPGSYGGVSGGTGLVNAMRAARTAGLPLRVVGNWNLSLNTIWIPDGVVVNAAGATFTHTPLSRFRNAAKWPATTMPDTCGGYDGGSFTWDGGTFDGGGDGIFTISHSPGFTLRNATLDNYCSSDNDGHAIEINSSGGPDLKGADYRVRVQSNTFRQGPNGQRENGNDEPVHYDWAWAGSGCGGAEDHTMCHNVYVGHNTFRGPVEQARCAIGGHRMSSASYGKMGNAGLANPADGNPTERHNSFLIENNSIYGAIGATVGVSPNKGAIALFSVRGVNILANLFYDCTASRLVSAFDATQNLNSAIVGITASGNKHNGVGVTISMPAAGSTGG